LTKYHHYSINPTLKIYARVDKIIVGIYLNNRFLEKIVGILLKNIVKNIFTNVVNATRETATCFFERSKYGISNCC